MYNANNKPLSQNFEEKEIFLLPISKRYQAMANSFLNCTLIYRIFVTRTHGNLVNQFTHTHAHMNITFATNLRPMLVHRVVRISQ